MATAVKTVRKIGKKVKPTPVFGPFVRADIRAGLASAAPPLGPTLGQRGLNVASVCKAFNEQTAHILKGTLLPVRIWINPDRTFRFEIFTPVSSWLIRRAAGIGRGGMSSEDHAGTISVKAAYEIAKIKHQDDHIAIHDLKELCQMVIRTAVAMGIKVVREDIDPETYRKFLESRKGIVKEQLKELEELKAAKLQKGL